MNKSREYVGMMIKLYEMQPETENLWKRFDAMAEEFDGSAVSWKASATAANWIRAVPKACFENCRRLVKRMPGLKYYEGTATSIIPMEHAWVVTPEGRVLEPTLCLLRRFEERKFVPEGVDGSPEGYVDYFGIHIPTEKLAGPRTTFAPLWLSIVEKKKNEKGKKR